MRELGPTAARRPGWCRSAIGLTGPPEAVDRSAAAAPRDPVMPRIAEAGDARATGRDADDEWVAALNPSQR
jgi:hypothetical protein